MEKKVFKSGIWALQMPIDSSFCGGFHCQSLTKKPIKDAEPSKIIQEFFGWWYVSRIIFTECHFILSHAFDYTEVIVSFWTRNHLTVVMGLFLNFIFIPLFWLRMGKMVLLYFYLHADCVRCGNLGNVISPMLLVWPSLSQTLCMVDKLKIREE